MCSLWERLLVVPDLDPDISLLKKPNESWRNFALDFALQTTSDKTTAAE
jgi:hypothetical protein